MRFQMTFEPAGGQYIAIDVKDNLTGVLYGSVLGAKEFRVAVNELSGLGRGNSKVNFEMDLFIVQGDGSAKDLIRKNKPLSQTISQFNLIGRRKIDMDKRKGGK